MARWTAVRGTRGLRVWMGGRICALVIVAATIGACASEDEGDAAPRVAIVPFVNETGNAALDPLAGQVEDAAAAAAGQVEGAELVRVSSSPEASPDDPDATIASTTGAGMLIRGSIRSAGDQLELHAQVVDPLDGSIMHDLPPEMGSASDPSEAVDRLASRIAGMFAMHSDREWSSPQLYSVPTNEAYRIVKHADTLFNQNQQEEALPFYYEAYALDTTYLQPLFMAAAVNRNRGRGAVGDSLLDIVAARSDELTQLERYNLTWYRGTFDEAYRAAKAGAELDIGWSYGVGLRANQAGYYAEAVEYLSRRAALAEDGNYSAQTWPAWRGQYMRALHALADYQTDLAEVEIARSDLSAPERWVVQELRARAAMGQVDEVSAIVDRLLTQAVGEVNLTQILNASQELKLHGHREEGEAVAARAAEFALANESALDSMAVAATLYHAGMFDEALPRLATLAEGSEDYVRVGAYGGAAALAGESEIADQVMTRLREMGNDRLSHLWRAYVSAAGGNCDAAVAHFGHALERRQVYAASSWRHQNRFTEPIWECEAWKELGAPKTPS